MLWRLLLRRLPLLQQKLHHRQLPSLLLVRLPWLLHLPQPYLRR